MKTTRYFDAVRVRPDRIVIREQWVQWAVARPERETVQRDGRIRRWVRVPEFGGRWLRVVLLADGETVHNAFVDRGYEP